MARPLSLDLRERIVEYVEAGGSRRGAAAHFRVSPSCVVKLMLRKARTGSAAPAPMGGNKGYALAAHAELVKTLIAVTPDMTLDELRGKLAERAIAVTRTSIWRFLASVGLTLKKRHSMRANSSAAMSPRRVPLGGGRSRRSRKNAWSSSTKPGRRPT
jgi:transposase